MSLISGSVTKMCGTVKLDASVQTGETCKAKQNTATKMLRVDLLQKNQMDKNDVWCTLRP